MYCPQCGWTVSEEDSFCPRCGLYLTVNTEGSSQTVTDVTAYPEPVRVEIPDYGAQKSSKKSTVKFLAIMAVVILLAVLMFIPQSDGSLNGKSFSESAVIADDAVVGTYYCITPTSGFVDDEGNTIATIEFTDGSGKDNSFRLTLSDTVTGYCTWKMSGYSFAHKDKFEPGLSTGSVSPEFSGFYGDCTATVTYKDSTNNSVTETFKFTIDLHRSYSWKYDGGYFSFDTVIDFDDTYNSSSNYSYLSPTMDIVQKQTMKDSSKWSNTPEFIVMNEPVQSIADTLGKLYTSAYGEKALDQKYANFLLGYVQICYSYKLDMDQYDYEEYFAFPLQTIYSYAGDCEDTSILAAAIAGAAGFKTGVFLIPGHATVGIALDSYSSPRVSDGEILKQTVDGITYYSGETTVDSFQEIGIIAKHSKDDGSKDYYSDYVGRDTESGTYGIYPVDSEEDTV